MARLFMIVTLRDMFHLLLVLLRRADYYWLYDGSVCVQSQVGGREWL